MTDWQISCEIAPNCWYSNAVGDSDSEKKMLHALNGLCKNGTQALNTDSKYSSLETAVPVFYPVLKMKEIWRVLLRPTICRNFKESKITLMKIISFPEMFSCISTGGTKSY